MRPIGLFRTMLVIAVFSALGHPQNAQCQQPPLVIVTSKQSSQPRLVSNIANALSIDSQTFTWPQDIVTRYIAPSTFQRYETRFSNAKELYFNGEFEACLSELRALNRELKNAAPSVSFQSELHSLSRDALLYTAMASREVENITESARIIQNVARQYADLPLTSHEFPPWLRTALSNARNAHPQKQVALTVTLSLPCRVVVDGQPMTVNASQIRVTPGVHTFKALCDDGEESLVSHRRITENPPPWQPILVPGFRLSLQKGVLLLSASSASDTPLSIERIVPTLQVAMAQLKIDKLMVMHPNEKNLTAVLLDRQTGIQATARIETGTPTTNDITALLKAILNAPADFSNLPKVPYQRRKWFKRPAPWILVSLGTTMAATGLLLGAHYGRPSRQEPVIWALQLTGVTLAATGVVFFVLPTGSETTGQTLQASKRA